MRANTTVHLNLRCMLWTEHDKHPPRHERERYSHQQVQTRRAIRQAKGESSALLAARS